MGFDLALMAPSRGMARKELALCNEATTRQGLALTEQQVFELAERRGEVLRATGRVEFGRGVLVELVQGFCDSPYLAQETYAATVADLQDVFYRRKEDSEAGEVLSDDDLISALRYSFDNKAAGSVQLLEDIPVEVLRRYVKHRQAGDYHEKTQDAVFEDEAAHDGRVEHVRDELSRARADERFARPGNEYADGFFDGPGELYRVGFDANSRIGGSSLG